MEPAKRYAVPVKGLKNGHYEFAFRVDSSLFAAEECSEIKDGECDVQVKMERATSAAVLEVHIEGYVTVPCDRCLEEYRQPVSYDGVLNVVIRDAETDYDGETLYLSHADEEADLAHYIYESIVLALPYSRVHPDGECNPEMLAQINFEQETK